MGLLLSEHAIYSTAIVVLWKIEESIEQLTALAALSDEDFFLFQRMKTEKRQRQWLATRALINRHFGQKTQIAYHLSGQPYLVNNHCSISISHSEELVAIALNTISKIGIDIQKTSKKSIQKATDFFLNEEDQQFLAHNIHYNTTILYLLWSLKEAAFKYASVQEYTLRNHFRITSILPSPNLTTGQANICILHPTLNHETILLSYHIADDYVWAYTN